MWIEIRSAACGADLPNSTYGVLKSLNVHRNSTRTSTWLTGRSIGSVIVRHLPPERRRRRSRPPRTAPAGSSAGPRSGTSNANGQVRQTETTTSVMKLLPPISQNGRWSNRCSWSYQHVVDQAGVALEQERPGDHRGVDGQRVRDEEQRAQQAAATERLLQQHRRGDAEQPGEADREHRERDGDPERVQQRLAGRRCRSRARCGSCRSPVNGARRPVPDEELGQLRAGSSRCR